MTPHDYPEESAALCETCRLFGDRQWCLATSGNFSVRAGASHCLITQSGKDKSRLSINDLMMCTLDGRAVDGTLTPSAETALHTFLYRQDATIEAVLHTHSAPATVVSRQAQSRLVINGFEMQKAFTDIKTHESSISIPVFDNSQDMAELVAALEDYLAKDADRIPGFMIRGHGLYGWGGSLDEARRHTEALEFLIKCTLMENRR